MLGPEFPEVVRVCWGEGRTHRAVPGFVFPGRVDTASAGGGTTRQQSG